MKIGDLVYNSSIEMKGIIVEELVGAQRPTRFGAYRWFVILLEDGGTERASDLELEVIS